MELAVPPIASPPLLIPLILPSAGTPPFTLSCCPLVIWLNKWFWLWKVILRDTSSDPVPGLWGCSRCSLAWGTRDLLWAGSTFKVAAADSPEIPALLPGSLEGAAFQCSGQTVRSRQSLLVLTEEFMLWHLSYQIALKHGTTGFVMILYVCVCVCVCVCIIRCISALLCHSLVKAL